MTDAATEPGLPLLLKTLHFAALKHRNQRRKDVDGTPYINHPIALAELLVNEARVTEINVIVAAVLHDTLEDTKTTGEELELEFGFEIAAMVREVSDDKSLRKADRKRLQIEHAAGISREAKLVKLADKTCNVRDMALNPPAGWDLERIREYFDWARSVVDRLRGTHSVLEALFDQAYAKRP